MSMLAPYHLMIRPVSSRMGTLWCKNQQNCPSARRTRDSIRRCSPVLLRTGEHLRIESRVRRADGQFCWFLHHKVPMRDETGRIIKWYGASIDIEDRKRAEEALRRSEAYLAEAQRLSHTG